jgi:hypothetical protein
MSTMLGLQKIRIRSGLLFALVGICACQDDSSSETPDAAPSEELSDPLSMPLAPTLSLDPLLEAKTCGGCHPNHYAQWKLASHSYAMEDPVFRAVVLARREHYDGMQDRFCLQCHQYWNASRRDRPRFGENLSPIVLEA